MTKIIATKLVNIVSGESMPIEGMLNNSFTAVAGIGNPKKFIKTLESNGLSGFDTMIFKDHHKFTAEDFANVSGDKNIIMTYKDAVKCKPFASKNWWYLDIDLDTDLEGLW
jgi:tetraacyldisaccharide 4'-kinase